MAAAGRMKRRGPPAAASWRPGPGPPTAHMAAWRGRARDPASSVVAGGAPPSETGHCTESRAPARQRGGLAVAISAKIKGKRDGLRIPVRLRVTIDIW